VERPQINRPQIDQRQTQKPAPADRTVGQGRGQDQKQDNITRPADRQGPPADRQGLRPPERQAPPQRAGVQPPDRAPAPIPGVRPGENVPPQARAAVAERGARIDHGIANGVLLNRSFANRSPRNPVDRALAFSTFHGRFGDVSQPWRRRHHHRGLVIGWIGPLFWPFAFNDFVDYAFYPHAYDTFWPYAYDDVYSGVFGSYAYGSAYGNGDRDITVGRGTRSAAVETRTPPAAGRAALCSTQAATLTSWPIDRIAETVGPDESQRAALDRLQAATAQALDILRDACPSSLASTPTARLAAMRERLEVMLQAVRTIRPALDGFYQQLSDEQKARFNAMSGDDNQDNSQARRDLTQVCNENAAGIGSIPLNQIETTLRTSARQRDAFEQLQSASQTAAEGLRTNCPEFQALTPAGRVGAMEERLNAMLQAVQTVEPALQAFYGSLSDEQKERFNRLAPARG
jgi:hypothetical protein